MRTAKVASGLDDDEYCIARLVHGIGVVIIETLSDLTAAKAAKAKLNKLAAAVPGKYIIFNRRTGRMTIARER